jgi:hypothetical protein
MPGTLEQHFQDLEGFLFQPDAHSVLAKFARVEIDFERAETYYEGCALSVVHWSFSAARRPRRSVACWSRSFWIDLFS